MTTEEFNSTSFGAGDRAIYKGIVADVASVDFEEQLIGLHLKISGGDPFDISWVRCENVEFIPFAGTSRKTAEITGGI